MEDSFQIGRIYVLRKIRFWNSDFYPNSDNFFSSFAMYFFSKCLLRLCFNTKIIDNDFLRKGFLINTIALSVLLVLFPDHLQSVFSFLMHVVAVFRSHQSISCYGKGLSIVIAFSLIFQNKWFSTYKCVLYIFIFVKIFIKIHSKYFQCKKLCFFFKWDGILKWKLWSDLFLHIMGEFKGFSQRKSYLCS